jgi:hypothetical protein
MSIELKGAGYISMHESTWRAIQKIALEFGGSLEYESRTDEERGPGDYGEYVLDDNARAFAVALYKALHEIETGRLNKRLLKLAREAQVGNLRAVADLAFVGRFYVD